ncbi:MAG: hypothetical protein A2268_08080 [Candidatus Raymondbacteria bacterium RifOxyA12_full_50_37]|uniref:Uncharacterized protein n=1 Tax=Candidatus Raymondbacteria bacterium RIFOXYD12_FULL_49_13 TaxID=1817890 RepID=A0A1F7F185_UNCRA|nr:MAG: hypothetical protein A2268_08080 [Candidatus Raymondbacteria bacterium RifOxyA12_full_50_37]OGJ93321.1 MAG: hypothetical protein A2487_06855 [Candidatus Raymondbacteria bacterium RifOxyC12_full_50_8]OGJ93525.1 MAG: hypothetical protein A2248_09125 [Candidatus Raymondbacteria bacterium RIFOXYA2_FULL_49_16]OGJ98795.1 MAG: hypothetical protein A2453_09935 [Candidatus Raymondbacteria bacterium RIFOXYC2_FULL_50_21]OGK00342.1 MAG: hypothetical protein A2519_01105 [Candidatus Raymondbacteria b
MKQKMPQILSIIWAILGLIVICIILGLLGLGFYSGKMRPGIFITFFINLTFVFFLFTLPLFYTVIRKIFSFALFRKSKLFDEIAAAKRLESWKEAFSKIEDDRIGQITSGDRFGLAMHLYNHFLRQAVQNLCLTGEQKARLADIADYFNMNNNDLMIIHRQCARTVRTAVSAGVVKTEMLYELGEYIGLARKELNQIKKD